jgi:hypothetical protein
MKKRVRGDALMEEHTGSATMVNLDGRSKNIFLENPAPGPKDEKNRAVKKPPGKGCNQD